MKLTTDKVNLFGDMLQVIVPYNKLPLLEPVTKALASQKKLDIEITVHREKRSLNANAALWMLLGKMAGVLNTNKDDLYLLMLERYGVYTHVIVKPAVVAKVKEQWRTVRELGEVTVNGQTGIQLQCYFGSHTYNSLEFSRLLDGVISEAKDIGIDFISREERDLMIEEWGKQDEAQL